MGIIEKGQTVKVVGSEVKVVLHMRGRCEKYGSYDYDVGACEPGTAADGETISQEYTADHTIQSYEIEPCGGAMAARQTLKDNESWQDVMPPLPEDMTPSCKDQYIAIYQLGVSCMGCQEYRQKWAAIKKNADGSGCGMHASEAGKQHVRRGKSATCTRRHVALFLAAGDVLDTTLR